MKCPKSILASPYFDGVLKDQDRALFETHLSECPFCSASLAGFRGLHARFADIDRRPAPLGFSARVMARAAGVRPAFILAYPRLVLFAEALTILLMLATGVIAGGFFISGIQEQGTADIASYFSLDIFEPAPPDTVGGVYLATTGVNHEK